jgi:prepilin-type N-terminal cleavage/methylation domain-containing protein
MNLADISPLNSANSRYSVPKRHHACAFTLFELLVVILILALLALTLLPVLAKGRAEPQTTLCFSNFRQLASAWLMYADDNQGMLAGKEPRQGKAVRIIPTQLYW